MTANATDRRRGWGVWVTAVALGAVTVVGAVLLVRATVLGETLASGDGWHIEAKWSPLGSNVSFHQDEGSAVGGAGGLASPGLLTESITYVPPDGSATYVIGVLPAEVAAVRATAPGLESSSALHRVGLDVFYLQRIEGVPPAVRLEAVDGTGQVLETVERPVPGPVGGNGAEALESFTGAAHCGWESVEIIRLPADIAAARTQGDPWVSFVRDTEAVLPSRLVFGTFEAGVDLPERAAEVGQASPHGRVWLAPDQPNVAYVVADDGTVERWPAANPGCD